MYFSFVHLGGGQVQETCQNIFVLHFWGMFYEDHTEQDHCYQSRTVWTKMTGKK